MRVEYSLTPPPPSTPSCLRRVTVLAVAGVLAANNALAQQTAVCSNTPGTGERIECTEAAASTTGINIDVESVDISTTVYNTHAISAEHLGNADITLEVSGSSTINTTGNISHGVSAEHGGEGNITVSISDSTIKTQGSATYGIKSEHSGNGHATVTIDSSIIETSGTYSTAVANFRNEDQAVPDGTLVGDSSTYITNSTITATDADYAVLGSTSLDHADGDVLVDVRGGTSITITDARGGGRSGTGILATNRAVVGDVRVNLYDSTATVSAHGIDAFRRVEGRGALYVDIQNSMLLLESPNGTGVYARNFSGNSTADDILDVTLRNSSIVTKGTFSDGIFARNNAESDLTVKILDGSTITTESTALDPREQQTFSFGIFASHRGMTGDASVILEESRITTAGSGSRGLDARSHHVAGTGNVNVELRNGYITTEGEGAEGIYVANYSGMGQVSVSMEGGEVRANGENAHGIQVAELTDDGEVSRAAAVGEGGYRAQTVRINGAVHGGRGNGAGIFLAGGGKVYIGPRGTVGAASGIAIHASGGDPKLHVDMDLDGRRVREVIGDDYILNDGGETTLVVNDVKLHDGAMGNTGLVAANGAWDITLRDDGLTVDTSTSSWTFSQRATTVILDRDFSAEDFTGTEVVEPMSMEPMEESMLMEGPMLMEEYAPRAAVYETSSDLLFRLADPRFAEEHATSPVWLKMVGGTGSYDPKRSTVGATYDFDSVQVEVGLNAAFGEGVKGWISMRHTRASADVSSPTGNGEIEVEGTGPALGMAWRAADGCYTSVSLSLMFFDMDFSSDRRGLLEVNVDGYGHGLDFEVGREILLGGKTALSPRMQVTYSKISIDSFTDSADARVSFSDSDRVTGSLGAAIETSQTWNGGEFFLRGALDVERIFGSAQTDLRILGEGLSSESEKNSILLSLGGIHHGDRLSLSAGVSARKVLGSGGSEYSGFLVMKMRF